MIKSMTTSVSVNNNPDALLATAETLERDGKLLMSAKALENLLQLALRAAAETSQAHSVRRGDIAVRMQHQHPPMATAATAAIIDSERVASPMLKRHSSQASLAASSPRTLAGQPHHSGSDTPMSPATAVGGSSGTLRHTSVATPPPNISIGANAQQQHQQQQQELEHELDQLSILETERTRDVLVAAERYLSKCNAFALVFLRDEEDTYSCTEVLCRALLYVLDGAMLEGTTAFVSVLPAESAAKQLIGFSGLRASAHIGAPTLPRGVVAELKKRLPTAATTTTVSTAVTGSPTTATTPQIPSLPSSAIPWAASPQAQRRWLSACLNNYGCMHRKQLLHADAAQLFRSAAAVDRTCAPLALLNLSATFNAMEKRNEAAEVARYIIRALTTSSSGGSPLGGPTAAGGSARGALPMHTPPASSHGGTASQNLAAAAVLLPQDVLALGYHCLAITLETTDGMAACDAYKHALHVLRNAPDSQAHDVIQTNFRLYEDVLQQLLVVQQQQQLGEGGGLSDGARAGGVGGAMQPTAPPPRGSDPTSSSGGDGRRKSFRQLQQQQQRITRVASALNPTSATTTTTSTTTTTTTTAATSGGASGGGASAQQASASSSSGVAIAASSSMANPPPQNLVPHVPKAHFKEFRDTSYTMHFVLLGGTAVSGGGDATEGGGSSNSRRTTPTPPPPAPPPRTNSGVEGGSEGISGTDVPGGGNTAWDETVTTSIATTSWHANSKDDMSLGGEAAAAAGVAVATAGGGGAGSVPIGQHAVAAGASVSGGGGGRNVSNILQNYVLLVDGETVVQRLDPKELRPVVAGQPGVPTQQQPSGGNIAPRPPAEGKQGAAASRKKSIAMSGGATASGGDGGAKSPAGASLLRGGGGAPPKAVPQISAESILEESKRKDDVVSFLASRLTQLLRVEEYHSMRHLAAARIQFFIRPLIARRVMRFRQAQEARRLHLVELRRQAAARCVTRFFRRVVVIRQNVRDQRERLRLHAIKRKNAIVVFQKYTRRWNAIQLANRLRKQQRNQVVCAMQLQQWVRCCFAKGTLASMAAIDVAVWTATTSSECRARSATRIQAAYRGHRAFIAFLVARGETERALRLDRQKYISRAATTVQRYTRGFLVRRRYASVVQPRLTMARNRFRAQLCNQSAVAIQRCFRGHIVRHRTSWGPRVAAARQRAREKLAVLRSDARVSAAVAIQAVVRSFLTRCRRRRSQGEGAATTRRQQQITLQAVCAAVVHPLEAYDEEDAYFIGMRKGYGRCLADAVATVY